MLRREFLTGLCATGAVLKLGSAQAQTFSENVYFERPAEGKPHKGKVLAAIQPHSDDIPLTRRRDRSQAVKEGYTGYLIRATNDDMGDDVAWTPGTIGENVLRNERESPSDPGPGTEGDST